MSFVSFEFSIFFLIFLLFYYTFSVRRHQNLLIVVGSYIFYGWWDWRFVPLLAGISIVNYFSAIWIDRAADRRSKNVWLIGALLVSLVALAIFKYFDFFSTSFAAAVRVFGIK